MRKTALLGALLLAGALNPIHDAVAAGVSCSIDMANGNYLFLGDSTPASWDLKPDGSVEDGSLLDALGDIERTDAYDGGNVFGVDDGTHGMEWYSNPDETCTYEVDGQQVALPPYATDAGLELSRKIYVPTSGPGYARFYNAIHNPGDSPVTMTVYPVEALSSGLGSDDTTTIEDSSAGPGVAFVGGTLDTAVSWLVTSDGSTAEDADPVIAHVYDAIGDTGVRDRLDEVVLGNQPDAFGTVYENVTVPAGGTVAYMYFAALRPSATAASDAAEFIASQPPSIFAGLTDDELAAIQNWNGTDLDGDGSANSADNCRDVPNPGQDDSDGDDIGDACDPDLDGDGIDNDVETAFGTNPAAADTDGDAVADNADSCPKVSGTGLDGCPVTAVPGDNVRRASTTTLKVTKSKTGPVVIRTKGKVVGSGEAQPGDCTNGLALVVVKVNTLAVRHRLVQLTSECTFAAKATLHKPRRLLKNISVVGRFLGSDGLLPSKDTARPS